MPIAKGTKLHPRAHDLTGRVFGKWTVVVRFGTVYPRNATWWCRCQCGTEKEVRAQTLVRGGSKSCGCERKRFMLKVASSTRRKQIAIRRAAYLKTVIGKRFGMAIVESAAGTADGFTMVNCVCDCGVRFQAKATRLIMGRHKACRACVRKQQTDRLRLAARASLPAAREVRLKNLALAKAVMAAKPAKDEHGRPNRSARYYPLVGNSKRSANAELTKHAQRYIGNTFDLLTVIALAPQKGYTGSLGTWFICRCVCGDERAYDRKRLRKGRDRACGNCKQSKALPPVPKKDRVIMEDPDECRERLARDLPMVTARHARERIAGPEAWGFELGDGIVPPGWTADAEEASC